MESVLTLQSMLELAGVIIFIQVILTLFIKPAFSEEHKIKPWYGLLINALCFLLGFMGSCIASAALGILTTQQLAQNLFLALEATIIATSGFEIVKNIKRVLPRHK